ncbi:MAG: hypothetical protein LIO90_11500 [Bacteroidales bacterium]|nr:hypothetical protein [Bacteroidales bacterium]
MAFSPSKETLRSSLSFNMAMAIFAVLVMDLAQIIFPPTTLTVAIASGAIAYLCDLCRRLVKTDMHGALKETGSPKDLGDGGSAKEKDKTARFTRSERLCLVLQMTLCASTVAGAMAYHFLEFGSPAYVVWQKAANIAAIVAFGGILIQLPAICTPAKRRLSRLK